MKTLFATFCLLLISSCCEQARVTRVSSIGAASTTDRGVYYYLPRTDLVVDLEVTRKTETPGSYLADFNTYSALLGLDQSDVIMTVSMSTTVKAATLRSLSSIDAGHIYRLELPRKALQNNSLSVEYLPSGELKGGKATVEDQTMKLITFGLKTVAGIGSAVAARSDSKDIAVLDVDKTPAGRTARKILDIRDARYLLLSGPAAGANKEALAYKIEQLDKQEAELLAKFLGSVRKETSTVSILVDPADAKLSTTTAFPLLKVYDDGVEYLASSDRIVWKTDLDSPLKAGMPETVTIRWAAGTSATAAPSAPNLGAIPNCALVYRVPATKGAVVEGAGTKKGKAYVKRYLAQDVQVPQLGAIAYLPRLNEMEFQLHEGLGGLKTLTAATKAPDPDQLAAIRDAVLGLDTAFKKPEATDPRDKQITDLEKDLKIKELLDKLNGAEEVDE